jgi:hypothetical protein
MNGKQSKKLRSMAALFFQSQPPNIPKRKTLDEIYQHLKIVHKKIPHGKKSKA